MSSPPASGNPQIPQINPAADFDFLHDLNPQQKEVVTAPDGPILVIAGAGSGKTRTVTCRVAWLLSRGVSPASVLLVTFTNKAAREMLRRVEETVGGGAPDPEPGGRAPGFFGTRSGLWGGTFHHIGHRFLRRHADRVGYAPGFTLLDREDAADLLEACVPPAPRGERRLPKADPLLEILSLARNTLEDPARRLERERPEIAEHAKEILDVFRRYEARKRELGVMDFDDLLLFWHELLTRHGDLRAQYRERFRHVLADEYQDTNRVQAEILDHLSGEDGNLTVVGDDAQSIYSFRGAHFGNILRFTERHPRARVLRLETNYRSVQEILDLTNATIARNERQHRKVLRAHRGRAGASGMPLVVTAGDVSAQAAFVADRLQDLRREGRPWREAAVLYRAHYHSMEIQMELTRRAIPFVVRSGLRFFEQAHVKDVAAWLRIIANPRDEVSWKRVIRLYPKMGQVTAEKVWNEIAVAIAASGGSSAPAPVPVPISAAVADPPGAEAGTGAAEGTSDGGPGPRFADFVAARIPKVARDAWAKISALYSELRGPDIRPAPADMIARILARGYEEHLNLNYEHPTARMEDLRQLADYAANYGELAPFLDELTLMAGTDEEEKGGPDGPPDAVVLSSVHQAKGLEWDSVFVVWLVENRFPDARCAAEPEGLEEERRLFYVASTRARDRLFLLHPAMARQKDSGMFPQPESRFLQELPPGGFRRLVFDNPYPVPRFPRVRSFDRDPDGVSQITPWDD